MTEEEAKQEGHAAGASEEAKKQRRKVFEDILLKLKRNSHSGPFLYPVDPVQLNIPDYYDKIKHPMDLSTVKKSVEADKYGTLEDFRSDVELMFQNCFTYNLPDSTVHKMGASLEKYFKQILQKQSVEKALPVRRPRKRRPEEGEAAAEDGERGERRRAKAAGGISDEELGTCSEVLEEVMKPKHRKYNRPFMAPVDAALVPDYYATIKNPMDLSKMRQKVRSRQYGSLEEFVTDFTLMVENCYTFNAPDTEVYFCGKKLFSLFNTLLESRCRKGGLENPAKAEDFPDSKVLEDKITELKCIINKYETELRRLEMSTGKSRHMRFTYDEKKKLKRTIENLPVDKLKVVVSFIQKNIPSVVVNEMNDIELDLDKLDTGVLAKLNTLASGVQTGMDIDSESSSE